MIITWLTLLIRLGISPNPFMIFLLAAVPSEQAGVFQKLAQGLKNLTGILTVS